MDLRIQAGLTIEGKNRDTRLNLTINSELTYAGIHITYFFLYIFGCICNPRVSVGNILVLNEKESQK